MSEQFDTKQTDNLIVKGTVVSVKTKDGSQSGRYQIQLHTAQDSGTVMPDETIECGIISHDAPFYGLGQTGSRYKNGQVVTLLRTGQQNYEIVGANPNARGEEDGQNDNMITASLPKGLSNLFHRDNGGSLLAYNEDLKGLLGDSPNFQQLAAEFTSKMRQTETTLQQKAKRMGKDPITDNEARVRRVLRDFKELGRYAKVSKSLNKTIGSFAFNKADMKDPTSYIQKILGKKGELIPNALEMMKKLKSSGGPGLPIPAISAVGGSSLVQQALTGVAQSRSQQSENFFDLLEYLCKLYEELFPDRKCKDDLGKFTQDFERWRRQYMLELNQQQGAV